jgi:protein-tyrosine-phosphatase
MTVNILFVCEHNSARSILAEAALNHIAKGRFRAFSAASHIRDQEVPNPFAIKALKSAKIDTSGLRSKSWDEFSAADAPSIDLLVTLCNESKNATQPNIKGNPFDANWQYDDPLLLQGTDKQKQASFNSVLLSLRQRLDILANLPNGAIDRLQLQKAAQAAANM